MSGFGRMRPGPGFAPVLPLKLPCKWFVVTQYREPRSQPVAGHVVRPWCQKVPEIRFPYSQISLHLQQHILGGGAVARAVNRPPRRGSDIDPVSPSSIR